MLQLALPELITTALFRGVRERSSSPITLWQSCRATTRLLEKFSNISSLRMSALRRSLVHPVPRSSSTFTSAACIFGNRKGPLMFEIASPWWTTPYLTGRKQTVCGWRWRKGLDAPHVVPLRVCVPALLTLVSLSIAFRACGGGACSLARCFLFPLTHASLPT